MPRKALTVLGEHDVRYKLKSRQFRQGWGQDSHLPLLAEVQTKGISVGSPKGEQRPTPRIWMLWSNKYSPENIKT